MSITDCLLSHVLYLVLPWTIVVKSCVTVVSNMLMKSAISHYLLLGIQTHMFLRVGRRRLSTIESSHVPVCCVMHEYHDLCHFPKERKGTVPFEKSYTKTVQVRHQSGFCISCFASSSMTDLRAKISWLRNSISFQYVSV